MIVDSHDILVDQPPKRFPDRTIGIVFQALKTLNAKARGHPNAAYVFILQGSAAEITLRILLFLFGGIDRVNRFLQQLGIYIGHNPVLDHRIWTADLVVFCFHVRASFKDTFRRIFQPRPIWSLISGGKIDLRILAVYITGSRVRSSVFKPAIGANQ
jgi:hypothetical protein